jgi:UDP-N-acetylmuramyl pentapeptide phosphotransferase/UDP-N-acetylglucosamine-1-phosphate transferase
MSSAESLPLLPAIVATAATAAALGLTLRSPIATRLVDRPNERSLHVRVTPRIGGLGLAAGLIAALAAMPALQPALRAALAAAALLWAVSLLDDLRGLGPGTRLLAHLAAVAAWLAVDPPAAWLWPVAVLAIAWSANLYNFMDGADGLAGGMAVFGFGTLAAAAWAAGDVAVAALCASIAGSALGFLAFNFPPARLFMGDAGSIPLGFLAGAIGWHGAAGDLWSPALPVLAFLPFLFDASLTLARRAARGEVPWHAHRDHLYQRAVRSGATHRRVATVEYLLMAACSALAFSVRDAGPAAALSATAVALAAAGAIAVRVDRLHRASVAGAATPREAVE